ncbi:MAG TPA: succinylglutamate desuccinylase/aspartoacylase family protein [Eoetvoesiella sp.]
MNFQIKLPDLTLERQGNTGTPGVWHFDSGIEGPSVLVTALTHGNEICGAWALKELLASGVKPVKGKLTLAFCNLAAFDRFDVSAHDASRFVEEDLNRVWSSLKLNEPTTVERQRALELRQWVRQADWMLDLHSMHEPSPPLLLTGLLQRNIDLGIRLGIPEHIIVDAGHKDGTRMRDFEHFGEEQGNALALLIECGYHGDPSSVRVAQEMVGRFLTVSGVVDVECLPGHWLVAKPIVTAQKVLKVTAPVVATSMDLTFVQPFQGMECIEKAGTVIGHDNGQPIRTPYDNCVLVMPSLRQLVPGVSVVRFAQGLPQN